MRETEQGQSQDQAQKKNKVSGLNLDRIGRELKDVERFKEFQAFAECAAEFLPAEERRPFLEDPVAFTSSKLFFRGLERSRLEEVLKSGKFKTQPGAYDSEAVFMTNRFYSAFTYQHDGAIAMVDPTRLIMKTSYGIVDVRSKTYEEENKKYLLLAPPSGKTDFIYTIDNRWDLMEYTSSGVSAERTFALRLPQPVSCVTYFLIREQGGRVTAHKPEEAAARLDKGK